MASIVYVTDKNMIEFHRLNGNQSLNFWRPMSQKKIRNFHPGDMIFFLTKTINGQKGNEKGIVGYGKYVKNRTMSFDQMWRQYQQENGYSTKAELSEAICNLTSDGELPEQLNCLYIQDVLFFNHPIYLSEFGMNVPVNMESYMYLDDKNGSTITCQILEKAKEIGIDIWSAAMNNKVVDVLKFEEDVNLLKISALHTKVQDYPYTESESKKNKNVFKEIRKNDEWVYPLIYSEYEWMKWINGSIHIYIPAHIGYKDANKLKLLLGHILMWKEVVKDEKDKYVFHVLTNDTIKTSLVKYFDQDEQVIIE